MCGADASPLERTGGQRRRLHATGRRAPLSANDMGDDQELVRRVLEGDRNAFRDLVRRYERLVAHIVARMVLDSRDREELCQDVFVRVHDRLPGFRFEARLSTWIAKIAYRVCLNALERIHPQIVGLDALPDVDFSDEGEGLLAAHADSALAGAEHEALVALVHRAIDTLPLAYRTAVTLYHLDELRVAEIADIMGIPDGTVKSYLFRARRMLREQLAARYAMEDLSS